MVIRWPSANTGNPSAIRRLSLALQGGGSFGAFTWGVLERLLDDGVPLDVVSGTSAGALNAVLLASGLAEGAREHFQQGFRAYQLGLASEVDHTARAIYEEDLAANRAIDRQAFSAAEFLGHGRRA